MNTAATDLFSQSGCGFIIPNCNSRSAQGRGRATLLLSTATPMGMSDDDPLPIEIDRIVSSAFVGKRSP